MHCRYRLRRRKLKNELPVDEVNAEEKAEAVDEAPPAAPAPPR